MKTQEAPWLYGLSSEEWGMLGALSQQFNEAFAFPCVPLPSAAFRTGWVCAELPRLLSIPSKRQELGSLIWSPFPYNMGLTESINIKRDIEVYLKYFVPAKCTSVQFYNRTVLRSHMFFSHVGLTVYLLQSIFLESSKSNFIFLN